ncbi:MAG: hypothetical protein Q4C54_09070 [Clostridia bacterium]|nr:hypothetical protein [Clostridia bacterium]
MDRFDYYVYAGDKMTADGMRPMSPFAETFEADKYYFIFVDIVPKDGNTVFQGFNLENGDSLGTGSTLLGVPAVFWRYPEAIGGRMMITTAYGLLADASEEGITTVSSVDITGAPEPAEGVSMSLSGVQVSTAGIRIAADKTRWQEAQGDGWVGTTDSTFQAGKRYRLQVSLTAETNYRLAEKITATINGSSTGVKTNVESGRPMDRAVTKEYDAVPETTYQVTTGVNGTGGTISSGRTGLRRNEQFTVTFTPAQNYVVDRVTVNGIAVTVTGNTLILTMNEDKSVAVSFKPVTYNLTTSVSGGNGTISAGAAGLAANSVQTVTFTPDAGYEIDAVTVNGNPATVTGNTYTLTMVKDMNVVVTYKRIVTTLSEIRLTGPVAKDSLAAGTLPPASLTSATAGATVDSTKTEWCVWVADPYLGNTWMKKNGTSAIGGNSYGLRTNLTLAPYTVLADNVRVYYNGEDVSGGNTRITKDSGTVTVAFSMGKAAGTSTTQTYTLTTRVEGGHGTITEGKAEVVSGSYEWIFITPDEKYEVDTVTVNGKKPSDDELSTDGTMLMITILKDTAVVATFKPKANATFDLTTSVNGGNGTISAGKTNLMANSTEIVTFTPDAGYMVDTVTVNGTAVKVTGNNLILQMTDNMDVVVTFKSSIPVMKPSELPMTGDDNHLGLWIALTVLSALALLGIHRLVSKRRW